MYTYINKMSYLTIVKFKISGGLLEYFNFIFFYQSITWILWKSIYGDNFVFLRKASTMILWKALGFSLCGYFDRKYIYNKIFFK